MLGAPRLSGLRWGLAVWFAMNDDADVGNTGLPIDFPANRPTGTLGSLSN